MTRTPFATPLDRDLDPTQVITLGDYLISDHFTRRALKITRRLDRSGYTIWLRSHRREPEDIIQDAWVRMLESLERHHPDLPRIDGICLSVSDFDRFFQRHVSFALRTICERERALMRQAETLDIDSETVAQTHPGFLRDQEPLASPAVASIFATFRPTLEQEPRLQQVFDCLTRPPTPDRLLETQCEMARSLDLTDVQFTRAKAKVKKRLAEHLANYFPERATPSPEEAPRQPRHAPA